MYADISVTLPIAEALVGKGLGVGQMRLSFAMTDERLRGAWSK
jgi:hypothetical protein